MARRFAKVSSVMKALCCVVAVAAVALIVASATGSLRADPVGVSGLPAATSTEVVTSSPFAAPSTTVATSSVGVPTGAATTTSAASGRRSEPTASSPRPASEPVAASTGPRPEAPWFAGRVGGATRVISVVGQGGSNAVLSTWQKSGGDWTAVLDGVGAKVGSPGISASYGESSSATPAGVFSITSAFGRQPDPGTGVSYLHVDTSDWWVSDVNSPDYNTHQRCAPGTCPFNEQASENLWNAGAVYDYALVMGVNTQRTPGAGSAFFLHVTNGAPTAGCVAISASTLVSILRWVQPGTVIALSAR